MHINELTIKSFRTFNQPFKVKFNSGLNVIVGENGAGKTAIISALRQLFVDSEAGRYSVTDQDFYQDFPKGSTRARDFAITASFADLDGEEELAFLTWKDAMGEPKLNLHVENRETRGRYKRTLWGGLEKKAIDTDILDFINCIYLPPLRDAEEKLSNGTRSRLAKLLKTISKKELKAHEDAGTQHPLVERVEAFNTELADSDKYAIKQANQLISKSLKDAIGVHFSQATRIQFSESDFSRIVEGLRLLYFPSIENVDAALFRSLNENSLGYNNLIYIASILAELTFGAGKKDRDAGYFRLLLIEEPEAHLHPQLQTRLLRFLSEAAEKQSVQVIVTTHSTVLASAVPVQSILHVTCVPYPIATPLSACGLEEPSRRFINRWLDVTKSNLLFARGLLLVEGIAEAILLPVMAKTILADQPEGKRTLDDMGISVISLNGIYFKHFMQLFCNLDAKVEGANIPIRCAGLTDLDPAKTRKIILGDKEIVEDIKPHKDSQHPGTNHALDLVLQIGTSEHARLFVGAYKTFEYDCALEENNIRVMAKVMHDSWPTNGRNKARLLALSDLAVDWTEKDDSERANAAFELLNFIENDDMGKGLFAQLLADVLENDRISLAVPAYITGAVKWSCGLE
ncbi:ATP-dependent nuclease [Glaciimonas sp. GG7]